MRIKKFHLKEQFRNEHKGKRGDNKKWSDAIE